MRTTLRGAAVDLLLGARCAGCAQPGPALCPTCRRELRPRPWTCWPDPPPPGLVAAHADPFAAAAYADLVRRLVVSYKDSGRADLAEPLGRMLAVVVEHALGERGGVAGRRVELVPVPSSRVSVRRRGRDPVADLARAAARLLRRRGREVHVSRRLDHRRVVRDQAGLSTAERAANLHGALRAATAPVATVATGRSVLRLVVDDVLTTGATADEAVRALTAAGWQVHAVATVAATRRRRGRPAPGPELSPTRQGG
ncbi:ComF family protein [soil metagenome]